MAAPLRLCSLLVLVLVRPAAVLGFAPAVATRGARLTNRLCTLVTCSAAYVPRENGGDAVKDALMNRAVEVQVEAFAIVKDVTHRTFLANVWTSFKAAQKSSGRMTDFLDVLMQADTTEVFVPTRSFRRLSHGNPYANESPSGYHATVEPSQVALRLMECRKQLAHRWLDDVDLLCSGGALRVPDGSQFSEGASDTQLLRGLATRLAVCEMLHDLSLLPSQADMHGWLRQFVLDMHWNDLTRDGSVEALLYDLAAQPLHIRGNSLVDPLDLSHQIVQRSNKILDSFGPDLHAATGDCSSRFLECCFLL